MRHSLNRAALAIAILCTVAACGLACESADPDPARFETEIRAFGEWDSKNSYPQDAILFVGSSSIRLWRTAKNFPDLPVINRGFGGAHISDVNHFVDRVVLKYSPRTIVFYAGDNDIAAGKSPQQVAGDFRRFVEIVHQSMPNTRVIYLPIKPSVARWKLWPQMQSANSLIAAFAAGDERLECVDTATPLLGEDRRPRSDLLLDDGLHLNAEGYRLWTEALAPVLDTERQCR